MKELMQSILVYVVIVSVLKGLIGNPKYSQYFQFFSGIIMILIMLSPILSVFSHENNWYEILEENVLQMDLENVKAEMEIADAQFAELVEREYEETAAKQVIALAENEGVSLETVEVEVVNEAGSLVIEKVTVVTSAMSGAETGNAATSIETIQIGNDRKRREADTSKRANSLRRQICDCFVVGEEKVLIWK